MSRSKLSTYILLLCAFVLLGFSGCTPEFSNIGELLQHLNDTSNGYVQEKIIGDKIISVKYLPPEFFSLRSNDTSQSSKERFNRYFLLSIGKADKKSDIMYESMKNYEDYSKRAHHLNFNLDEHILLTCGKLELHPVLVNMENTYGLQSYRNFMVVFSPQESKKELFQSETITFSLNDTEFRTGINHFEFQTDQIDQELKIVRK